MAASEVLKEDRDSKASTEGKIALAVGGQLKFPGDMVVVPHLVSVVWEEWLMADVAGPRDSEEYLRLDDVDEPLVVELQHEHLMLQLDHLLDEPLLTILRDITLVIALNFWYDGDHIEAYRARRLRLLIEGMVEVRLLHIPLKGRVDHHGDSRAEHEFIV